MEQIKNYFGVGSICNNGSDGVLFQVKSIKELSRVIKHFDKYPLISQKLADYLLWKKVILMMERKEHLTPEGFEQLVALKASINLGLNDQLKEVFPGVVPVMRPLVIDQVILDPQ